MIPFALCLFVVVSILLKGGFGQVPDYETTLEPLTQTSFTCQGRAPGYYADVETGCRTYHVCDGTSHFTYICPRRTLFQQRSRICDHSYLVRCEESPLYYEDYYPEDLEAALDLEDLEDRFDKEDFDEFSNKTEEFVSTVTAPLTTYETTEPTVVITSPQKTTARFQPIRAEHSTSANQKPLDSEYYRSSPTTEKYLKFSLKDFRSLFYIPEFENNSIATKGVREFAIPIETFDLMRFKSRPGKSVKVDSSRCPTYCNPKFFLPGTCHPCLMIK